MRFIWIILLVCFLPFTAAAHEIRPALLELVETEAEVFQVTWKQPVANGRRLALEPVFPASCERKKERRFCCERSTKFGSAALLDC